MLTKSVQRINQLIHQILESTNSSKKSELISVTQFSGLKTPQQTLRWQTIIEYVHLGTLSLDNVGVFKLTFSSFLRYILMLQLSGLLQCTLFKF